MKAQFEVKTDTKKRVLFTRMTGIFSEAELRAWAKAYVEGTDQLKDRRHIVVADMRGMRTVNPSIVHIMGEAIGYARQHGVVLCAHVSDDVVQRLQAARVARQNSADDDATIEVESPEEAYRVVESYLRYIDDPRFAGSIRSASISPAEQRSA
jgi:hypothetical protein